MPKYEGWGLVIYLRGSGMPLNLADRVFVDMHASRVWQLESFCQPFHNDLILPRPIPSVRLKSSLYPSLIRPTTSLCHFLPSN